MDSQPKLTELQLDAWRAFLTAHARVIGRIDAELAAAGRLPLGSYDVLIELAGAPEHRLRMSRLARQVVLSDGRYAIDHLVGTKNSETIQKAA